MLVPPQVQQVNSNQNNELLAKMKFLEENVSNHHDALVRNLKWFKFKYPVTILPNKTSTVYWKKELTVEGTVKIHVTKNA